MIFSFKIRTLKKLFSFNKITAGLKINSCPRVVEIEFYIALIILNYYRGYVNIFLECSSGYNFYLNGNNKVIYSEIFMYYSLILYLY